jgi:hypothetical protein
LAWVAVSLCIVGLAGLAIRAELAGHRLTTTAAPSAAPALKSVFPAPELSAEGRAPSATDSDVSPARTTAAAADGLVPPLAAPGPTASAIASPVRVVIEASGDHPGVGQPVDFTARVLSSHSSAASRVRLDGARFRISGPGLASAAELSAADDGSGLLKTTFTFLQPGRFEVAFIARSSGAPVHAARSLVVTEPATKAAPSAPAAPSGSTASPAAKWL